MKDNSQMTILTRHQIQYLPGLNKLLITAGWDGHSYQKMSYLIDVDPKLFYTHWSKKFHHLFCKEKKKIVFYFLLARFVFKKNVSNNGLNSFPFLDLPKPLVFFILEYAL